MNAEILAIGSELLTPRRIDTNSLWLTDQLNSLGVEVVMKCAIGDDRARLTAAIRDRVARAEVIVLTGGLGPTEDDLTRDAVAAALGRNLVFHQELLDGIEARFRTMNRPMAEINRRQAYLIEGAEALDNINGTAPGQWIDHDGRMIMLLPGPPRELKPMFVSHCLPRLQRRLPQQCICTRFYRVAMMPESDLDQLIAPSYTKYSNPVTTVLAAPGDIEVHLRARCGTVDEAEGLCARLGAEVEALLGDRIYSRDGSNLECTVGNLLRKRGETLAVAESCTGGLLAQRLTSVAGSSTYFLGGFVTYSNAMKVALLGVDPKILDQYTAVSEQAAEAMALGARETTEADWTVAVTGEAGPDSATGAKPGTVIFGLAGPGGVTSRRLQLIGDRERVRAMASQAALEMLRRRLIQ